MTRYLALAIAVITLAAGSALAQKTCSKADEAAAQKAIDRVSSWASLSSAWKSYKHCDKGEVGDAYTEALLRLIIDWKNIEQLATAMKDPDYDDFVITHLRSPSAKADADDVYARAKTKCPKELASWCSGIASAVDQAPPKPIMMQPVAPAEPAPATAPPAKK